MEPDVLISENVLFSNVNRLKLQRSPYSHLLKDKEFHTWLENVERGSINTAMVSFRKCAMSCRVFNTTPSELAGMDPKKATYFLLNLVSTFERQGMRGSTIESYVKAVKSWLAWNDIVITKKIRITGANESKYETETVPTREELRRILDVAFMRTKVSIALMAYCGVRPEVLGNLVADDGLKLGDFPELRISEKKVEFEKIPTLVTVRKVLSKAGHNYFVFLPTEGCEYLRTFLEWRMQKGEELKPESPIIVALEHKDKAHITEPKVAYDIKTAITKAGFGWRPYVLRRYFEVRMMDAEHDRMILQEWRSFWMGHSGNIEATYSVNKGLPKDVIERIREAYAKAAEKHLVTIRNGSLTQDIIVKTFNTQFLQYAGYTEDELAKLDLDALAPPQVQELVKKKQMESLGLNGNSQKLIKGDELEKYINEGWEYVTSFSNERVIIKLPAGRT